MADVPVSEYSSPLFSRVCLCRSGLHCKQPSHLLVQTGEMAAKSVSSVLLQFSLLFERLA